MKYLSTLSLIFFLLSCNSGGKQTGLLIDNGMVYLPDGSARVADILIVNDRIKKVAPQIDGQFEQVIHAEGQFIMPGLIDAHAHFEGIGESKANLNLLSVPSWKQTLQLVKEQVENTPEGEWIIGRGWHQDKWTDMPEKMVAGNPVHDELSAISPNHPIMLDHASGHGILVNKKAMELAGITKETIAPEGGFIIKDEQGIPTGVFQENAENLVKDVYRSKLNGRSDAEIHQDWKRKVELAEEECLQYGITSLHDAGIQKQQTIWYQEMVDAGDLDVRIYSMISDYALTDFTMEELEDLKELNSDFFQCRAIKAYMDGALGSRGAWLLEDYHDQPGYRGENVTAIDDLKSTATLAHKLGFQLCIHAIGDRGNREVIDVFEQEMGDELATSRWRIEHAQHLHPNEIDRIGALHILASMQTVHCTSDSPFVEKRLGQQRAEEGAYVWQSLLANDVRIANGTDSPVESVNPFENMYAAVTRKRKGESEAFYGDQKLTRQQALNSYTIWNAYAAFQEEIKGSVEEGKLADLVILDTNLLTCTDEEILDVKVLKTIVGGEVKYEQ